MTIAPILTTERLVLRPHAAADFTSACEMWADPLVVHYITGNPSTPQQTWGRILTYTGHWALLGFGYWAVEEAQSRQFVGEIGFADFKRGITPALAGVPEMGMAFLPRVQGRGYATEALRAALRWADEHLGPRTVALIHPDNAPSVRVAERVGYARFDAVVVNGSPALAFERRAAVTGRR